MMFVGSALTPRTKSLCFASASAYPLPTVISAKFSPLDKSEVMVILVFEIRSEIS